MQPLLYLTLGLTLSTLHAWFAHKTNVILPNYRYLDAMKGLRLTLRQCVLLLPTLGAFGIALVLPHELAQQNAHHALGLAPSQEIHPALLLLPSLPGPLFAGLWMGVAYALLSIIVWPKKKLTHAALGLLLASCSLALDPVTRAVWRGTEGGLNWWMGPIVASLLWGFGVWLGRHSDPETKAAPPFRASFLLTAGALLLGQLGSWWAPQRFPALVGILLLTGATLLCLAQGAKAIKALLTLTEEASFAYLRGAHAYVFGATWPFALCLGWVVWLVFGGRSFGHPLQESVWPMLLLVGVHFLVFWAFSLLEDLHTTALVPPSRLWLLVRPLLLYLVLFLLLGLPGLALLKATL